MNDTLFRKPNFRLDYDALLKDLEGQQDWKKREVCRELCLNDMYFLLRYGCGVPAHIVDHPFAVDRCADYDRYVRSPRGLNNRMTMVFRFGYKSMILNYGANIQKILRNPEDAICIFSFNKSLAVKHLKPIMGTLEGSDELKNWFDEILYEKPKSQTQWSAEDGATVRRKGNRAEPTIYASGLVTGMPVGMHFNDTCYDDVVTRDSVKTRHSSKETMAAYKNSLSLGIAPPGVRTEKWVLGTFYKYGDCYCKMREECDEEGNKAR